MRKDIFINGRQGKLECTLFEPDNRASEDYRGSFLFLPGLPGTDKNEDLAETLCFDGFRVLCLSFSGTCGSDGTYSLEHSLEDAETAYNYLAATGPGGVSIFGHSMGGFVSAQTAATHPETKSLIMMFPCDIGRLPIWDSESIMTSYVVKDFMYNHASSLSGVSSEELISEIYANANSFSLVRLSSALSRIPILMIGGTKDRYAPPALNCQPLYSSLKQNPDANVTYKEFETGHYGADCRGVIGIAIEDFLRGQGMIE